MHVAPPLKHFSKRTTKFFSKPKTFFKNIKHNIYILKKRKKNKGLCGGHHTAATGSPPCATIAMQQFLNYFEFC
jgi:hypothetical protein